jgi:hypothetical protein
MIFWKMGGIAFFALFLIELFALGLYTGVFSNVKIHPYSMSTFFGYVLQKVH